MADTDDIDCGLKINKKEFLQMRSKEQMGILFENQLTTIELIRSYKIHQKVQYGAMSILFILAGYFLTHLIGQ